MRLLYNKQKRSSNHKKKRLQKLYVKNQWPSPHATTSVTLKRTTKKKKECLVTSGKLSAERFFGGFDTIAFKYHVRLSAKIVLTLRTGASWPKDRRRTSPGERPSAFTEYLHAGGVFLVCSICAAFGAVRPHQVQPQKGRVRLEAFPFHLPTAASSVPELHLLLLSKWQNNRVLTDTQRTHTHTSDSTISLLDVRLEASCSSLCVQGATASRCTNSLRSCLATREFVFHFTPPRSPPSEALSSEEC